MRDHHLVAANKCWLFNGDHCIKKRWAEQKEPRAWGSGGPCGGGYFPYMRYLGHAIVKVQSWELQEGRCRVRTLITWYCDTVLSSGGGAGRSALKHVIALTDSGCSQAFHGILSPMCSQQEPCLNVNNAVSSWEPVLALCISELLRPLPIDHQLPEALIWLEAVKLVSISGAWLRFQSKGKSMTSPLLASVLGS